MQVKKLSLTYFLARRRTNIKKLLQMENITSAHQLQQWCNNNGLELTHDIDVDSLFPKKETPVKRIEPSRVVVEAPIEYVEVVTIDSAHEPGHASDINEESTFETQKKPRIRKAKVEEIEDNQ